MKCGCLIYLFLLSSANLICRNTDISKYFRKSLGLRDNENRLYLVKESRYVYRRDEDYTNVYVKKVYLSTFIRSVFYKLLFCMVVSSS